MHTLPAYIPFCCWFRGNGSHTLSPPCLHSRRSQSRNLRDRGTQTALPSTTALCFHFLLNWTQSWLHMSSPSRLGVTKEEKEMREGGEERNKWLGHSPRLILTLSSFLSSYPVHFFPPSFSPSNHIIKKKIAYIYSIPFRWQKIKVAETPSKYWDSPGLSPFLPLLHYMFRLPSLPHTSKGCEGI